MKQVFPDIRPRRLGTRGHSRYCYAAMRKATKLSAPHLPEIRNNETTSKKNNNNGSGTENESTWKVIKNWSENLLGNQFESLDDLAEHISHNNLNIPSISSSTSKQVLQKKLMQREMKDRKRNNVSVFKNIMAYNMTCFFFVLSSYFHSHPESIYSKTSQKAKSINNIVT